MKNHWVELRKDGNTCFGQIQDAGPGVSDDAAYVFGSSQRSTSQEGPWRRIVTTQGVVPWR